MSSTRTGIVVCAVAAAGYGLLELAYFGQRNHLLPWSGEHASLFLIFFALHLAVALLVWGAARVLFRSPLGGNLALFAPVGALVAIHAVTYFRERKYSLPRDLVGTLITLAIVAAFALAVFGLSRFLRDRSALARRTASFLALALVGIGLFRILTVEPTGEGLVVAPRPERDVAAATDTGERVFLLGIDGITWDVLDPLVREGSVPNLASLIGRGRTFDLETIRPTFSPVIWTSIVTGKNRFQHGIHDVIQTVLPGGTKLHRSLGRTAFYTKTTGVVFRALSARHAFTLRPYRSHQIRATSIFELATESGLSASQIEWYVSWPARSLSGVVISDRFHLQVPGEPIPQAVSPGGLAPLLESHIVGDHDVSLERVMEFVDAADLDAAQQRRWANDHPEFVDEMRLNLARDLTTRNVAVELLSRDREWRIFGVYFRAVDLTHHLTWPLRDAPGDPNEDPRLRLRTAIRRYHEFIDGIVGEVLAEVPPEAAIIALSDHGFEDRYSHSRAPDGFAIAAGGAFVPSAQRGRLGIYDVAPTAAVLLGLPVAEDLVAGPRTDLISPEFLTRHPVRSISTWEREDRDRSSAGSEGAGDVEDAEVDRLRALGYID